MTDSPFLPGTKIQFAWDSTSLGYLKTCPRLYQYSMIDGWQSEKESVHLRFGIEYHEALQGYDLERSAGITHDDAVHDVVRGLLVRTAEWDFDHDKKTRPNLIRAVIWYLDQYRDETAVTHLLADGRPALELSFRFELPYGPNTYTHTDDEISLEPGAINFVEGPIVPNKQPYLLCGHLDKVIEYSGSLYVRDYKTVWSFWGAKWEPDNQMTLYSLAAGIVLAAPVAGVHIDMAMMKENSVEFKREITQRTKDQLAEWNNDLHYWLDLAERYALADYWPMNDTSCGKYGGCRFREVCSKSPAVRHHFLNSDFVQLPEEERWNPLRSRG